MLMQKTNGDDRMKGREELVSTIFVCDSINSVDFKNSI